MVRALTVAAGLAGLLCAQPADLRLKLLGSGSYRERELVRLEMAEPGREWQFVGFVVEPARECGTIEKPCPQTSLRGLNVGFGIYSVSDTRVVTLNHYVPDLRSGHYRVKALLRKMVVITDANGSYGRYAEPAEYSSSAAVDFDVTAGGEAWTTAESVRDQALLKGPPPKTPEENRAIAAAAEQLSWLDTAASREAALDVLPVEESVLLSGLRATREPEHLCDRMQARIGLPSQSVSTEYMQAIAETCAVAHLPPAPQPPPSGQWFAAARIGAAPVPARPPTAFVQPDPAIQAWSEKRRQYIEELWSRTYAALAASLARKEAEPKTIAFATLMQRVQQVRADTKGAADPAWAQSVAAEFGRSYPAIDVTRKPYLLSLFTSTFHGADTVPLLESVMDSWKPGDYYEAVQQALRAFHAIDPAKAQARIRAEMVKPETWLDVPQLELLPAGAVPAMDDQLIEALAAAQRPPGWNPGLRMAALARYGTPAALGRVKAIYESQQVSCQPELVAYFVRVDPAYADRIFHSHPWDMQTAPPPCAVQYFERTPRLAMSKGLEEYIAAYLMSSDIWVKTTAARSLARYGSASALPKLWEALQYFADWWKGKSAELAKNQQSVQFEVELHTAIARGRGWFAGPDVLKKLDAMCLSSWCKGETRSDLNSWDDAPRIELNEGQNRVAQYYGLETIAALENKLEQFPRGTHLRMTATGKDADEVRRFALSHGLVID